MVFFSYKLAAYRLIYFNKNMKFSHTGKVADILLTILFQTVPKILEVWKAGVSSILKVGGHLMKSKHVPQMARARGPSS